MKILCCMSIMLICTQIVQAATYTNINRNVGANSSCWDMDQIIQNNTEGIFDESIGGGGLYLTTQNSNINQSGFSLEGYLEGRDGGCSGTGFIEVTNVFDVTFTLDTPEHMDLTIDTQMDTGYGSYGTIQLINLNSGEILQDFLVGFEGFDNQNPDPINFQDSLDLSTGDYQFVLDYRSIDGIGNYDVEVTIMPEYSSIILFCMSLPILLVGRFKNAYNVTIGLN